MEEIYHYLLSCYQYYGIILTIYKISNGDSGRKSVLCIISSKLRKLQRHM